MQILIVILIEAVKEFTKLIVKDLWKVIKKRIKKCHLYAHQRIKGGKPN